VDRAYRASTRLIGIVTFLLGLTMIAVTLARGGGALAVGVVAGVLFTVLGAIRYAHASRRGT
jgi:cell division protein FtsX